MHLGSLNKVFIGLGANLGDRIQNIIDARQSLHNLKQTSLLRCSSLYLSSPVGFNQQANFINCVIELYFAGEAIDLFREMQKIETEMGRLRDPKNQNAARLIDLDLLLFAEQRIDDPKLTIPHPRLAKRLFVIQPLLELEPELLIPGQGQLETLLHEAKETNQFDGQVVHRLAK